MFNYERNSTGASAVDTDYSALSLMRITNYSSLSSSRDITHLLELSLIYKPTFNVTINNSFIPNYASTDLRSSPVALVPNFNSDRISLTYALCLRPLVMRISLTNPNNRIRKRRETRSNAMYKLDLDFYSYPGVPYFLP